MPPKRKADAAPPSKRDQQVWVKYGLPDEKFKDPHAYNTMDVFGLPEARTEYLHKVPDSIKLLELSGGKPLMSDWYNCINGDANKPSLQEWEAGLHRPLPEPELIAVTADQLSDDERAELSSGSEYDVQQPVKIHWDKYKETELDTRLHPFSLYISADFNAAELDIAMSALLKVEKKLISWDVEMRRHGAEFFELSLTMRWSAYLRYYKVKYSDLFVVLYLRGSEKLRLDNYFYLEVA